MDTVFAFAVLALIIVIIIAGEIYLRMNKNSSLALFYLSRMEAGIVGWLSVTERLFALDDINAQAHERFKELLADYRGLHKKHAYQKAPILNEIHILVKCTIAENSANPDVAELGNELSQAFFEFAGLRDEYNRCVKKLNTALATRLSGTIGRWTRVRALESLAELSV